MLRKSLIAGLAAFALVGTAVTYGYDVHTSRQDDDFLAQLHRTDALAGHADRTLTRAGRLYCADLADGTTGAALVALDDKVGEANTFRVAAAAIVSYCPDEAVGGTADDVRVSLERLDRLTGEWTD